MSWGRQAAGMLGAHPAWPGKVPSVCSQTWSQHSWCRAAAAAAANGIFFEVDITALFPPAKTKEFSLSGGPQCPGHPEKLLLGLVLGLAAPCRMPRPSPFTRGPNICTKYLFITWWKNQCFVPFVMLIMNLVLCVLLSWSWFLISNKVAVTETLRTEEWHQPWNCYFSDH